VDQRPILDILLSEGGPEPSPQLLGGSRWNGNRQGKPTMLGPLASMDLVAKRARARKLRRGRIGFSGEINQHHVVFAGDHITIANARHLHVTIPISICWSTVGLSGLPISQLEPLLFPARWEA
jgi:hypothetical protein